MANPKWPAALQDAPNQNYTEAISDGVVRSNPDVGPTQSRPRFTKTRVMPTLSIWVDKGRYKTFFDFYNIDLGQGCLAFDWNKPITGEPATMKFLKVPSISYVGPMTWEIRCELEEC